MNLRRLIFRNFAALAFTVALLTTAGAQVPPEFRGLWTSERNNCTGFYSDGVTVLGVGRSQLSWYEIVCSVVDVSSSGDTLSVDTNCEKGGGARYTTVFQLKRIGSEAIGFAWRDEFGGSDSQTVWACPKRHQHSFSPNEHPSVGLSDEELLTWDHNGSEMGLISKGVIRQFVYLRPRAGMSEVGASKGDILFDGRETNGQLRGLAYIFSKRCGTHPYVVIGGYDSEGAVRLHGRAPRLSANCKVIGAIDDELLFTTVNPLWSAGTRKP